MMGGFFFLKHGFICFLAIKQIRSENVIFQSSFILHRFLQRILPSESHGVSDTTIQHFAYVGCVLWLLLQEEQNVSGP